MELKTIVLTKGKEKSLERKHPWLFSGAINRIISDSGEAPFNGEMVEIVDSKNNFLATGHFSDATIAVRIISFKQEEINQAFWTNKVQMAFNVRESLGLTNNPSTNIYRLMHAEGDGLPGLVIDYYNGTAIIQAHSIGIYNAIDEISKALQNVYGKDLIAIYNKSAESIAKQTSEEV
jgi:23S rRNA (cytosine1962-C5)-methyltransferase